MGPESLLPPSLHATLRGTPVPLTPADVRPCYAQHTGARLEGQAGQVTHALSASAHMPTQFIKLGDRNVVYFR